jgi:transcription termination factor Rho
MFEISQLKEMKLPELQDIAKELNISKYRSLKKLDLVYQILDHQAANPSSVKPAETPQKPKPRRDRVQRPKDDKSQKQLDFKPKETLEKPKQKEEAPQAKDDNKTQDAKQDNSNKYQKDNKNRPPRENKLKSRSKRLW